jgi:hypothetical protein
MKGKISLIFLLLTLFSCESEKSQKSDFLSTSACSKKLPNGKIIDCIVDESVEEELTKALRFTIDLNNSHPGPPGPDIRNPESIKSSYVERIDEQNNLHIDNGDKIFFAGVECGNNANFKRYLVGTFLGEHRNRISYRSTGFEDKGVKYAYIWEIGLEYDTLSSSNETIISSLWCRPITQRAHLFDSRYQLIHSYAKENPH